MFSPASYLYGRCRISVKNPGFLLGAGVFMMLNIMPNARPYAIRVFLMFSHAIGMHRQNGRTHNRAY